MGVSLALVFIIAVASTVIRVAGVMLQLTGMPVHIARFQALSALTGAGFTTSESEQMLNNYERRKILSFLIGLGSLGLASLAATVIVGAFSISTDVRGLFFQVLALLIGVYIIKIILTSKKLDARICAIAYHHLVKRQTGDISFRALYSLDATQFMAEHSVQTHADKLPNEHLNEQLVSDAGLTLLGVRAIEESTFNSQVDFNNLKPNDCLILLGELSNHTAFANKYGLAPNISAS